MNRPGPFHVVRQTQAPETPSQRSARLQAEARSAAVDHIDALQDAIQAVAVLATEVGAGGESYPPGARDVARRLAEELAWKGQTLETILRNAPR